MRKGKGRKDFSCSATARPPQIPFLGALDGEIKPGRSLLAQLWHLPPVRPHVCSSGAPLPPPPAPNLAGASLLSWRSETDPSHARLGSGCREALQRRPGCLFAAAHRSGNIQPAPGGCSGASPKGAPGSAAPGGRSGCGAVSPCPDMGPCPCSQIKGPAGQLEPRHRARREQGGVGKSWQPEGERQLERARRGEERKNKTRLGMVWKPRPLGLIQNFQANFSWQRETQRA